MSEQGLVQQLKDAVKTSMRAKDKPRTQALRLIQAELKRVEVDERIELDDARVLTIMDKMVKQRRDSIKQYEDAGRTELAEVEHYEVSVIQDFLPEALSAEELSAIVAKAVAEVNPAGMQDMGKVMALVKPQVQGRADMGEVSKLVKASFA
ncbi:GatB/YqeY domain-containing protein [Bermanella sp. WJH001]|uniref:GatB/YqeY domain-containing protein n=1 Tax=Bermanella sp. WJH001 TaxID=3048005 RepID=UPI0024BE9CF6|nr:GatB/YqeY domain-containing protein [Bermanella sp. WJH001]MDJ1538164.1 GatB/YqeY domain-containing protein [Bermanella sp. WJH001]